MLCFHVAGTGSPLVVSEVSLSGARYFAPARIKTEKQKSKKEITSNDKKEVSPLRGLYHVTLSYTTACYIVL